MAAKKSKTAETPFQKLWKASRKDEMVILQEGPGGSIIVMGSGKTTNDLEIYSSPHPEDLVATGRTVTVKKVE